MGLAWYTRAVNAWKGISPEGWKTIGSAALSKAGWGAGIGAAGGLAVGAMDNTPGNTLQRGVQGAILGGVVGGSYGAYKGGLNKVINAALGKSAAVAAAKEVTETASVSTPLLMAPTYGESTPEVIADRMRPLPIREKFSNYVRTKINEDKINYDNLGWKNRDRGKDMEAAFATKKRDEQKLRKITRELDRRLKNNINNF